MIGKGRALALPRFCMVFGLILLIQKKQNEDSNGYNNPGITFFEKHLKHLRFYVFFVSLTYPTPVFPVTYGELVTLNRAIERHT
jgi:hypothetical protein